MSEQTILQALAQAVNVLRGTGRDEMKAWWSSVLDDIEDELPSGSGIDQGTKVDRERSTADKIILFTSFHHMSEHGYYDGWTEHAIIIRPSLLYGFTVDVKGRDRNDIKDYLGDVYRCALEATYAYPVREAVNA